MINNTYAEDGCHVAQLTFYQFLGMFTYVLNLMMDNFLVVKLGIRVIYLVQDE